MKCDCHIHVFGAPERYPPSPARLYTPVPATIEEYRAMASAMGLGRVVLVQASAYGTDNACMLDALRAFPATTRGIAVIDAATPESALDEMQRLGVRGIRVGLYKNGMTPEVAIATLRAASERVAARGWHVQILAQGPMLQAVLPVLPTLPTPIMVDHMGMTDAALGPDQPGLKELRALLAAGGCWVKLSGCNHVAHEKGFRDALPIMRALVAANPERIVWGTDWPHIRQAGLGPDRAPQPVSFMPYDNADLLRLLEEAVPEEATRNRILVSNPAALYGFPA